MYGARSTRGKREKILNWIGRGSDENKQRAQYARQLTDAYTRFRKSGNQNETRLMQMSRVMSMLQDLTLFGTRHWLGRQSPDVAKDRMPFPEMQLRSFSVIAAEYLICVGIFGLRFVAAEGSGNIPEWTFLFAQEAEARVVQWKAKEHVLQLIVQTSEEHALLSLFVESPDAPEIAYTMGVAFSDAQSLTRNRAFSRVE